MTGGLESESAHDGADFRPDLWTSLCVLAVLFASVLSGLAWEENWPKLLRVLIGFSAYVLVLVCALSLHGLLMKRRVRLPFAPFALAGAAAEIGSGWLRPTASANVDLLTAVAAALLIGGTHWLALRMWRPLRERIRTRAGVSQRG